MKLHELLPVDRHRPRGTFKNPLKLRAYLYIAGLAITTALAIWSRL
jgi:hypothetical protein